jgi:hypothetical protein
VAEYVDDAPVCGCLVACSGDELEAAAGAPGPVTVATAPAPARSPRPLPLLHLSQPAKVLAREVVTVRAARSDTRPQPGPVGTTASLIVTGRGGTGTLRASQGKGGSAGGGATPAGGVRNGSTLTAERLELLRNAFTLVAGSNRGGACVPAEQLTEVAVLAGLDPASPATVALLSGVRARAAGALAATGDAGDGAAGAGRGPRGCGPAGGAAITLEALLQEALHFRETPLVVGGRGGAQQQGNCGGSAGFSEVGCGEAECSGLTGGCTCGVLQVKEAPMQAEAADSSSSALLAPCSVALAASEGSGLTPKSSTGTPAGLAGDGDVLG